MAKATVAFGRDNPQGSFLACVAILALISCAAAEIGAVRTVRYGHDIIAMLDGAWRFLCGQRPHIDYSSGWGPLTFVIFGSGLALAGDSVRGFGYAQAMLAFLLGMAAWTLSRNRIAPLLAISAAAATALITVAPFPLGGHANVLSHAMSYNRQGYAMLGVLFLEGFLPARTRSDGAIGGAISGAIWAASLFLKASYFAVASVLMLFHFAGLRWFRVQQEGANDQDREMLHYSQSVRLICMFCAFAAVSATMLAYLHFDFAAVVSDLRMIGKARSTTLSSWQFAWALWDHSVEYLPLLACAAVLRRHSRASAVTRFRVLYAGIAVSLCGTLVVFSNTQGGLGFPLLAMFSLVLLSEVGRYGFTNTRIRSEHLLVGLIAILCFVYEIGPQVAGLGFGLYEHLKPHAGDTRFASRSLAALILVDGWDPYYANGKQYVEYVNSGIGLLRRHQRAGETVITMDSFNPFPYALLEKPPHGGALAMSYGNGFTDNSRPSPTFYFGDASIVMVPKRPSGGELVSSALWRIYGPFLKDHFRPCSETDLWTLYKRADDIAGCANGEIGDKAKRAVH